MIVETYGGRYQCARAEQRLDGIYLINEDESIYLIVSLDSKILSVEDGEIEIVEKPEPTAEEDMMALLIDQEYRLTLLELGLTE